MRHLLMRINDSANGEICERAYLRVCDLTQQADSLPTVSFFVLHSSVACDVSAVQMSLLHLQ